MSFTGSHTAAVIALQQVGKAMSSNETAAYEIMKSLDVDYVLIIFGGVIGYSGDDINKFLWMVRIAEGEHPRDIRVRDVDTLNTCSLAVFCACVRAGVIYIVISIDSYDLKCNILVLRPD